MHVHPFTLKRSMYDYKLYVSLLIFVYSLMDSDERASLQKTNVLNVKPFFVHVAQVMDVVILHVSFVHVSIYVAMNMFGMYMVHYML